MKIATINWSPSSVLGVSSGYIGRVHVFTIFKLTPKKFGLMSPMPQLGTFYFTTVKQAEMQAPKILKDYLELLLDNSPSTCYTYSVKAKRSNRGRINKSPWLTYAITED